jgi:hypothetical protein
MKPKVFPIFVILIFVLLFAQACTPGFLDIQPASGDAAVDDSTAPQGAGMARDAALTHLFQQYGEQVFSPQGKEWLEQNITPQDLVGSMSYQFTDADLAVTVTYPVVAPEATKYQVLVENSATGFHWQGEVDNAGQVHELAASDSSEDDAGSDDASRGGGTGSDAILLKTHADARNATLAYVYDRYLPNSDGYQPPAELQWVEMETSAPAASYALEYSNGDWIVRVEAEASAPYPQLYKVEITNLPLGFTWAGTVDLLGQITETQSPLPVDEPIPPVETITEATGWFGHVESLPAGAQWDDKLVLGNSAGEVGIEGATTEIQAQIVALRDQSEPGKYANFWGSLHCEVPDYGSCQFVVEQIRAGATFTDEEVVNAWQGTLVSNPPGSQFDDYFVLAGDFPVPFGIDSIDPALQAQLEDLRDSGQAFKVWGLLRTGVPDAYGSQIQVEQIELLP